ncbi:MAG: amino acid adenylation domain-containing protein [Clostridiaceae bacterium]|nr:amino acid adenylation domain-containing protein [Clostridiaceae bacterium]
MRTHLLEYLEDTVRRVPEKIAYSNGQDDMTFAQVYRESRAIGSFLQARDLRCQPVVVFMNKHPRAITAFLGVLYAGAAYVPIDEEMPRIRIRLILDTLQPRALICDSQTARAVASLEYTGAVFGYEQICQTPETPAALAAIRDAHIDTDPAYVVFTSGATGVPKGVVACHRSVIDYIEAFSEVLRLDESTVFGMQVPLYFDACLKEVFPTLKFGATTYIIPRNLFMFPVKLVAFLNTHQVNTLCWVVSALTMISAFGTLDTVVPHTLRLIAFGSEVMPVKQLRSWRKALPDARFINLYGPTEATGMSCYFDVDRDFADDEPIPIGRPFRNTGILLLGPDNRLARPGETGEICIRGTALTMGYYKAFDKTAEVFVQNPLNDAYPELIYRTGDLARLNERGELVFVSRKDYQIKHMGHRIELGEIEAGANALEAVRMAGCIYDAEDGKIVLFYAGDLEPGALLAALRDRLPRYMLPNQVEPLDRLPLTSNAKIDRVTLKQMHEHKKKEKQHG